MYGFYAYLNVCIHIQFTYLWTCKICSWQRYHKFPLTVDVLCLISCTLGWTRRSFTRDSIVCCNSDLSPNVDHLYKLVGKCEYTLSQSFAIPSESMEVHECLHVFITYSTVQYTSYVHTFKHFLRMTTVTTECWIMFCSFAKKTTEFKHKYSN